MKTTCIGLMGRIFGHKINRVLVAEIPIVVDDFWNNAVSMAAWRGETLAKRKWKVCCLRCGEPVGGVTQEEDSAK